MSALTTDTKILGSNAAFDPKVAYPGLVSIAAKVNFAEAPLDGNGKRIAASTNYDFLEIPDGFVLQDVFFKECGFGMSGNERCPAGTITLKTKSDSATIGAAVTVGGSDLAKSFLSPASVSAKDTAGTGTVDVDQPRKFATGDMLCFVASVEMAAGGFEAVLVGYFPDGDGSRYTPVRSVPWRKIGNTNRNVAEPDRLLGK